GPDSSTGVRDQTTLMTRTMTRRSTTRSRLLAPIWTATKDHTDLSESLLHVASCLKTLGRDTEALPKFEAAYEMLQRIYKGRDQSDVARSLNNIAFCLGDMGRFAEAGLEMSRRIFKGDNLYEPFCLDVNAACLKNLGRSAEALPKYEAAYEM